MALTVFSGLIDGQLGGENNLPSWLVTTLFVGNFCGMTVAEHVGRLVAAIGAGSEGESRLIRTIDLDGVAGWVEVRADAAELPVVSSRQ